MNQPASLVIPAATNAKFDLKLAYVAPVISGREFPAAYQILSANSNTLTAPQITTQPVPVTINSGGTATFTVTASGTAPVFQWYAGTSGDTSKPQPGATGTSFTTPVLTTTTAYWVRASNAAGTADSITATATLAGISTAGVTLGNLTATYDGTAKSVTATTTPAGLPVTLTYNGSSKPPTNVGSYAVDGTVNDPHYQGKASATLVITKGLATLVLGNLNTIYNGSAKPATAVTTPAGLAVTFTYNGSTTVPKNAGSYAVIATINNAGYQGTATGTLVIGKATATVALGGLAVTYSGSAKSPTVSTNPSHLAVVITYDGLTTAPKNVGTYAVTATINNANYQGGTSGFLTISKATAKIKLGTLTATYSGTPKPVTASTTPSGLAVVFTYNGSATPPTSAGSYSVAATINDLNYQGSATGTLVISKATAAINLGGLTTSYTGNPAIPTATTTPPGMAVLFTYGGSPTPPVKVGSYAIVATLNDSNYQGKATGKLVITVAPAPITPASAPQKPPVPSFATWAATHEAAHSLAAGTIANQPNGDFDHDGRSNLLKYAFGTRPVTANDPAPHMPSAAITATHWVLHYQRDTTLTDLTFTPQASTDQKSWYAPGQAGAPKGFTDTVISTSGTVETHEASIPRDAGTVAFLRVSVSQQ